MIDPNLLRQLGWSESLISEVTRVADSLRDAHRGVESLQKPSPRWRSECGTALYADLTKLNTGFRLSVKRASESVKKRNR